MDAALKRIRWRLRRAVHAMGWAAIGGVALAIFAAGFVASNLLPLQANVTALRDRVHRLEMRAGNQARIVEAARPDARVTAFYEQFPAAEQAPARVRRLPPSARHARPLLAPGP